MAHLRATGRGERGQIILVAAFLIAVTFVVLALVVNSAIFTENMATRDDVAGSHDALEHRAEVQDSVGTALEAVNENSSQGEDDLNTTIGQLNAEGGGQKASQGRLVNVSVNQTVAGTRIAQDNNESYGFLSNDSDEYWTVAEDVSQTRNLRLNFTDPVEDVDFELLVEAEDGSTEWLLTVEGDSGPDVEVTVESNGEEESCERDGVGEFFEIDVTGGTVAGEPCHALTRLQEGGTEMWFGAGVDAEYNVTFDTDKSTKGTYSMIVDEDADFEDDNFEDDSNSGFPYYHDAIYSVTVSYEFYTSAVGYETDIRVAPGEAPP